MVNRVVSQGTGDKPAFPYYRYLYLKAREDAYIQLLSTDTATGSDLFICHVHHVVELMELKDGTKKERYPIYICFPRSMSTAFISGNNFLGAYPESKDLCKFCADKELDEWKTSVKFYYWVYVKEIWHKTQNPRLASDPNSKPWVRKINKGGEEFFVESINFPMILEQNKTFSTTLHTMNTHMDRIDNKMFIYNRQIIAGNSRSQYNIISHSDPPSLSDQELLSLKAKLPPIHTLVVPKISPRNLNRPFSVKILPNIAKEVPPVTPPKLSVGPIIKAKENNLDTEVEINIDSYLKEEGLR